MAFIPLTPIRPFLHRLRYLSRASHPHTVPSTSSIRRRARACLSDSFPDGQIPNNPTLSHLAKADRAFSKVPYEADIDAGVPPGGASGAGFSGDGDDHGDREEILRTFSKAEQLQLKAVPTATLAAYQAASTGPLARILCVLFPGWRNRVLADPNFPFKVLMEETVGLGLAALGMVAARGKNIINEIDFALCDILVGGTLNFMLVYLLSPVYGAAGTGLAALPTSAFAVGNYSISARLAGFVYKGFLFGACGFTGSLVGTGLNQMLIFARRTAASFQNREYEGKEMPDFWKTACAWAGFMFVSANPRYQSVAGVERALFSYSPPVVAKLGSATLRTLNNVGGGANWVWWAKTIGLQSSQPDEKEE